jgi:hypothetical protein
MVAPPGDATPDAAVRVAFHEGETDGIHKPKREYVAVE